MALNMIKLLGATLCAWILFVIVVFRLNIHIDINAYSNQTFIATYVVLFVVFLFNLWDTFKSRFVLNATSWKVVLFPIALGAITHLAVSFIRFLPLLFHGSIIDVAKGQYTNQLHLPPSLDVLMAGPFTAFNEETVFRFLAYAIPLVLAREVVNTFSDSPLFGKTTLKICCNKLLHGLYVEERQFYVWTWIVTTATAFALAHEPNITNFYMYFFGGILYGFLFFRYGLLASMLAHLAYNMTASISLLGMLYLFSNYMK